MPLENEQSRALSVFLYCYTMIYLYYSHLGFFPLKHNNKGNDIHKEYFKNTILHLKLPSCQFSSKWFCCVKCSHNYSVTRCHNSNTDYIIIVDCAKNKCVIKFTIDGMVYTFESYTDQKQDTLYIT